MPSGPASRRSGCSPYATDIIGILPATLTGIAKDIDAATYSGAEDRVSMEHAALEHIVAASRAVDVDPSLALAMRDLAARALAAGDGDLGWSKVFDHM